MLGYSGCLVVGKCENNVDKGEISTGWGKRYDDKNIDDCHARAKKWFEYCGNRDEYPITATLMIDLATGHYTSISYPKRKGSRNWI